MFITMMNTYYYTLLAIFAIIIYLMVVDKNVSIYIDLLFKLAKVNISRFFWMIRLHPKNPITNFIMKRKINKIIKDKGLD